jgi:type III polyketide synthase
MSPTRDQDAPEGAFGKFGDLDLSIIGLGVEYPPFKLGPEALDTLVKRHYPDSPAWVSSLPSS